MNFTPRHCSLDFTLKTYCPTCDANVESNERYTYHSEEGNPGFSVYICPGCKLHMHHVPITKEEYLRTSAIAEEIIKEIIAEDRLTNP